MADRFNQSLQESIITLLGHSDQFGRIVAQMIDVELLEGDYQEIAKRFVRYWRDHDQAPKTHAPDLFDDILRGKDRRAEVYRRTLLAMLQFSDAGINAEYVMRQIRILTRKQMLKDAVFRAAQAFQSGEDEETIEQVETIISDILRAKNWEFNKGATLGDIQSLVDYIQNQSREFATGIEVLDQRGIVPHRGGVLLMLGGKGRGKTWFLTNVGRVNLRRGLRVLHASCENSEEENKMRYWQAMFAVPKYDLDEVEMTRLERQERRRGGMEVTGTYSEMVYPEFTLASEHLQTELTTRVELMGNTLDNLIIKRFPNRTLTPAILRAYLDSLEQVEGFVPDLILLDYVKLMKTDPRNIRASIGNNFEEFRAICVERNIAGVTVDQLNRPGYQRKQAHSTHIAEDWSEVHTADDVVIHSATDTEFNAGLGRLWVEHSRTARDKWGALITQNYTTGQFCIDSALLPSNYFEEIAKDLEPVAGADDEEPREDEN